jgi:hypothetical protein
MLVGLAPDNVQLNSTGIEGQLAQNLFLVATWLAHLRHCQQSGKAPQLDRSAWNAAQGW